VLQNVDYAKREASHCEKTTRDGIQQWTRLFVQHNIAFGVVTSFVGVAGPKIRLRFLPASQLEFPERQSFGCPGFLPI
jgi:hypothetical protein